MYCPKCGNELNDEALFCPHCGEKLKAEKVAGEVSEEATSVAEPEPVVEEKNTENENKKSSFANKIRPTYIWIASEVSAAIGILIATLVLVLGAQDWDSLIWDGGDPMHGYISNITKLANGVTAGMVVGIVLAVLVLILVILKYVSGEKNRSALLLSGASVLEIIAFSLQGTYTMWLNRMKDAFNVASGSAKVYPSYSGTIAGLEQFNATQPSNIWAIILIVVAFVTLVTAIIYPGKVKEN